MEKMIARFGPAGNSESFAAEGFRSSCDAPGWIAARGLDAYEYQCGRGVLVGEQTAQKIGAAAREFGVALSIHAPYFMNLSNPDEERQRKTVDYVLQSARAARAMGADRIVIHSGSLLKRERHEALAIAKETLRRVLDAADDAGFGDITLCPELMGCVNQLGTLDEVLELCLVDERLIPCIDFGHYNARNFGILTGREVYERLLDRMEQVLGFARVRCFHSHFSKIQYSKRSGEVRHLTFADTEYGPEFAPLAAAVAARGYTPRFLCESAGTQVEDAATMRDLYRAALREEERGCVR